MRESKYGNFLTVLLIIVIIAIIGVLAFGGYKVYQQFNSTKDANEFVNYKRTKSEFKYITREQIKIQDEINKEYLKLYETNWGGINGY